MSTIRRGRPRPRDVVDRDGQVKDLLDQAGPLTRNEIAERTGLAPSLAYLALTRLKGAGQVRRCLDAKTSAPVWTTNVDGPCP